jgi:hypothetical protein
VSTHPNARDRRTYPPLPSDITVNELLDLLRREHWLDSRVVYFKVKVSHQRGTTTHESLDPDDCSGPVSASPSAAPEAR